MPKPQAEPQVQWEASAPDLTPFGTKVQILGREWEPGAWQDVTADEKAMLDRNFNVLIVREKASG